MIISFIQPRFHNPLEIFSVNILDHKTRTEEKDQKITFEFVPVHSNQWDDTSEASPKFYHLPFTFPLFHIYFSTFPLFHLLLLFWGKF